MNTNCKIVDKSLTWEVPRMTCINSSKALGHCVNGSNPVGNAGNHCQSGPTIADGCYGGNNTGGVGHRCGVGGAANATCAGGSTI